ncbi:Uncharacterised protein [Afipia felis]|uniref:Uncharacterized protein n=2 Tax=Afipia felis TaxID=1035 RepID=A0A380W5X0_AFIFE|nr:hypothetical protein HMPREF9697_03580 [Afipia felis ATCC 53690]SUU75796.1 Uncharacterised protein [Afipia felis]SUU83863.1 Uncharacterised protein [Afipia felis]
MIDLLLVMPAVTASLRTLLGRARHCRAHLP